MVVWFTDFLRDLLVKYIQYIASDGAYKEKTKMPVSSAYILS